MEDGKILELFYARSEQAIRETETKYGAYCYSVAIHILEDRQDAQECVSDTWLSAWNSIPPQRPRVFSAFLARITRNLAIDRWRESRTAKRGGGEMKYALWLHPRRGKPGGRGAAAGASGKRQRLSGEAPGNGAQRVPVPLLVF